MINLVEAKITLFSKMQIEHKAQHKKGFRNKAQKITNVTRIREDGNKKNDFQIHCISSLHQKQ